MATVTKPKPKATNQLTVPGMQGLSKRKKIALVAVLVGVLGVGSLFGYQAYHVKQLKAHAAGWTVINFGNMLSGLYPTQSACKIYYPIYGGVYKIRILTDAGGTATSKDYVTLTVMRLANAANPNGPSSTYSSQLSGTWAYGRYIIQEAFVSIPLNDYAIVGFRSGVSGLNTLVGSRAGAPKGSLFFDQIINC